jgi:hypothetical protein
MLLRLARSQNYLAISPSRRHVAEQPAMEALPLVMEPESRFYTDPVSNSRPAMHSALFCDQTWSCSHTKSFRLV